MIVARPSIVQIDKTLQLLLPQQRKVFDCIFQVDMVDGHELLRLGALDYHHKFGVNYFQDLFWAHRDLGAAWRGGECR